MCSGHLSTPWTPEPIEPVPSIGIEDPKEGSPLPHLPKIPTNNTKKGVASIATNKGISLGTVQKRREKKPKHAKLKQKKAITKVKLNQPTNQLAKNLAMLSSSWGSPCQKKRR